MVTAVSSWSHGDPTVSSRRHYSCTYPMTEVSRPTVDIELITPETAKAFLLKNTANRSLRPLAVSEYAAEMKTGGWVLGCDAIGFDRNGTLINGQHRLNALVKSGLSAEFIVARDLPVKSIDALDIGKRRLLHERLTIAGNKLNARQTNICSLLITPWSSNHLVRVKTSIQRDMIIAVHAKYKAAIDQATSVTSKINGCELAAAVYLTNHASYSEVRDFLTLVTTGVRFDGTTEPGDSAARLYREYRINMRARSKRGNDMQNFRLAVTAAEKFASKAPVRALKAYRENPFFDMEQEIFALIALLDK